MCPPERYNKIGRVFVPVFSVTETSRSSFSNLRRECSWKKWNGIFIACLPLGPISDATFYKLDLFMTILHSHNLALTPCDTRTRCDLPMLNAYATGKINCCCHCGRASPPSAFFSCLFFTSVSLSSFSAVTFPRPISADFWVLEEQMAPAHDLFKSLT